MALYKPAGIAVHGSGRGETNTLSDWVLSHFPQTKDVGESLVMKSGAIIARHGIVHRLDKETSGVILVAKTEEGYGRLKKQFKKREVAKVYHAFVYGSLKQERGTIDRPIGRSKTDFRKRTAQRGARGEMKEAVTIYRVLKRNSQASFIEARPLTGRTHQIRVHMKAINHPIVADPLYAHQKERLLGFKRLALHAKSIEFKDAKGIFRTVEAPYPNDFAHALQVFVSE